MTKAPQPAKAPNPLTPIWNGIGRLAVLVRRREESVLLISERLATLEERLSALDGGDGRADAARNALMAANAAAVREGRAPLSIILKDGSKIEWTGQLSEAELARMAGN